MSVLRVMENLSAIEAETKFLLGAMNLVEQKTHCHVRFYLDGSWSKCH